MNLDELLGQVAADSRERLRWRVLQNFGIAPGSREAQRMKDTEVLLCGVHMLLDMDSRREKGAGDYSPAFDPARFEELKSGQ